MKVRKTGGGKVVGEGPARKIPRGGLRNQTTRKQIASPRNLRSTPANALAPRNKRRGS